MFYRRLYFVIPEEPQAVQMAADLAAAGVDRRHIHAMAGKGMTLEQLPPANERPRQDSVWRLQRTVWTGNLVLFSLGLIGLIIAIIQDSLAGSILSLFLMALTLTAGVL